jgi:hypothetical protein
MSSAALINIISDLVLFLELSADDIINPDIAVKKLEDIGAEIDAMPRDDQDELLRHLSQILRSDKYSEHEKSILKAFFQRS